MSIAGNQFSGLTFGITTDGAAYQGTDYNHDITVVSNTFTQTYFPISIGGSGPDRLENMTVSSNQATNCHNFATGWGWNTNVVLRGNTSDAPVNGLLLTGQWFFDDPSENFTPWGDFGTPGITNIISYCCGTKHYVWSQNSALYALDDRYPQQLPPGAVLIITNGSSVALPLMLSLNNPGAGMLTLNPLSTMRFQAQSNGFVLLTDPTPPRNLRVLN